MVTDWQRNDIIAAMDDGTQKREERELLARADQEILDLSHRLEEHRQLGELYAAEGIHPDAADTHRAEGVALAAMHGVLHLRRDMLARGQGVHDGVALRGDDEVTDRLRMVETLVAGLANAMETLMSDIDAVSTHAGARHAAGLRRLEALERHVIPRR